MIPRKHIPLNSPKFGRKISYLKLKHFCEKEIENEKYFKPEGKEEENILNKKEKFKKQMEIEAYINAKLEYKIINLEMLFIYAQNWIKKTK